MKKMGGKQPDTDSHGRISTKGSHVAKRKGNKNKMKNNKPKAKKMASPYKTKFNNKPSNKGKAKKFAKKNQEPMISSTGKSNDTSIVDDNEESPVNSILKKTKKGQESSGTSKEVSFSSEEKKGQKRKLEGDPKEETDPKTPKLCELKKKDRKSLRRKQESKVYDLALRTKKIWEDMRREDCTDEKRSSLCKTLTSLVQGHVKELIFAHDTVRVIECLMAHGNKDQRSALFEELKDSILLLSKSKYAKFFVLKVLKYGTKDERNVVIQSFVGQVSKLINHSEASGVLEEAYNEYANAHQRSSLLQEFYGPTFAVFKEEGVTSLQTVLDKHPAQKDSILTHLKGLLMKLTEKLVVKHSIVHTVLKEFLTLSDDKGRAEVIEAWRESLSHIVHTRDGARSAMLCLWHGTAKDRKVILKSFKTLLTKIALEEHGSLVLMALFDCVDDTKFVEKVIINELLQDLSTLVNDVHGRKVLLYLICSRDPLHFHPDIVSILSKGDNNAHSKKDAAIRRNELSTSVSDSYLKFLSENIEVLIKNNSTCLFLLTTLQKIKGDRTVACKALSKFVLAEPYHQAQGNNLHPVEHVGCNLLLKKLIKGDALTRDNTEKVFFSNVLVTQAEPGVLKSWIECNRGAFVLLDLLETKLPLVVKFVSTELQGMNKKLSQMKYKGAELLLKKLKETNVLSEK